MGGHGQMADVGIADGVDDAVPLVEFPFADKGEGGAGLASARRSADAMDVFLGVLGDIEVDHVVDIRDIESAGSDVRGNEELELAGAEVGHDAIALALAEVAVDSAGRDAGGVELGCQTIHTDLRATEDERTAEAFGFVEVTEGEELFAVRDFAVELLDTIGGAVIGGDSDALSVSHVPVDDAADAFGHGCAEEARLAVLRRDAKDVVDVMGEADIEHLVCFVEDGEAHVSEGECAALDVVNNAARGANDDVDATFEGNEVGLDTSSADEAEGAEPVEAAEMFDDIADLLGEFARWDEDDGLHGVLRWIDGVGEGQAERDGLAGASLSEADHVRTIEEMGEGGCLDGGGGGVSEGGDGIEAGVIDTECGELFRVGGSWFWQPRGGSFGCNSRRLSRLGFGGALAVAAATAAAATCWWRHIVRYRSVMVVGLARCAMGGGGGFDRSGCYGEG